MRTRNLISAGMVDAATSSLATFALGFYAARLDPTVVGAYALYFAALRLLQSISNQLVFLPIEIDMLSLGHRQRLGHFRSSLRIGFPVAVLAALLTVGTHMLLPAGVGWEVSGPLALTTALAALISPIQDHIRRVLHLASLPWASAGVSITQLAAAIAAIVVLTVIGVPPIWIPMGGLAFANIVSSTVGLAIARVWSEPSHPTRFTLRELSRSGSWLLTSSTLRNGAGLIAGYVIANLATIDDLGFAEAARILSQPLLVLATGLGFALRPRSMEAARRRDEKGARRVSALFNGLLLGTGFVAIVTLAVPWSWSPLPDLLPNAYVIGGLLAVRLAANVVSGAAFPYRFELQGARLEARLTQTDSVSALGQVLVAFTAPITQAFAQPLGILFVSLGQVFGYRFNLRPNYKKRKADLNNLRVLHLAQGALGTGGGPYNLRSLAVAQVELGMTVTVAGFSRDPGGRPSGPPYFLAELPLTGWKSKVRALARAHDVVHVHGMMMWKHARFISIASSTGAAVIVTPRSTHHPASLRRRFASEKRTPVRHLLKRLYTGLIDRPALQSASGVHVLSPYEATFETAPGRPILIHPYGIDPSPVKEPDPGGPETVFLFVGRLDVYQKGLDLLIDGFRMASARTANTLRLVVAGPGSIPYRAEPGHDGIEYVGEIDEERRVELMGSADYFVHPSRWEVMARAAREAVSQGVPLIATRESNFGDWVERYEMGIVADLSAGGVAAALEHGASLPETTRRTMRTNALEFAGRHRWDDLARATRNWYREVLE